jgi:hypothetical protein
MTAASFSLPKDRSPLLSRREIHPAQEVLEARLVAQGPQSGPAALLFDMKYRKAERRALRYKDRPEPALGA